MPKESMPPDLPPEDDIAEEIEAVPLVYDRNAEVRHVLQDVVLFAQDFMDVLDDLAEEPIVPLEIFFVRPDRPAGRFRGPGRQIRNMHAPVGQPYNVRPGIVGRRRQGGNIRQPQRAMLRRPPRIIDRPIRGVGNLRQPLRPVQLPADIPGAEINEGPDRADEPRECHASGDEPIKPSTSGAVQEEPSTSGAVQEEPSTSGAVQEEPSTSGAVQEGPSTSVAEQDKPTIAEAAGLTSPRRETGGLHRAEPDNGHSSPEQAKRARLDIPEVGSRQSTDTGSDDSSMEVGQDSPKSKKE